MGLIAMPPAIIEPADIEDFGAPELFATGWAIRWGPEVITAVILSERMEAQCLRRQAVARIYFPRSRWHQALDLTLATMGAVREH